MIYQYLITLRYCGSAAQMDVVEIPRGSIHSVMSILSLSPRFFCGLSCVELNWVGLSE